MQHQPGPSYVVLVVVTSVGVVVVVLASGFAHQVPPQFLTHFSGPLFVQNISSAKHVSEAQPASWQHQPAPRYVVVLDVVPPAHQVPAQTLRHWYGPLFVQKDSEPKHVSVAQPESMQHVPGPSYAVVVTCVVVVVVVVVVVMSMHQVPPQLLTHLSGPFFVQNMSGPKQVSGAQAGSWQQAPGPSYLVVVDVVVVVAGGGVGAGTQVGAPMSMPSAWTA